MQNNKCWCGQHRNHGGNKKLAALHSKMTQQMCKEEKEKLENLNGKPVETKEVVIPFKSAFSKTNARLIL